MRRILLIAAMVFASLPAVASDMKWWELSLAGLAAANTADTVTSLQAQSRVGCREENILYGPCFGARAVSIKAGYVGINIVIQAILVRHHPKLAKWFIVGNVGQSIAPTWCAFHNAGVK